MAGAVGFEPTVHDTKNRCLTTWLRPNYEDGAEHNFISLYESRMIFLNIWGRFAPQTPRPRNAVERIFGCYATTHRALFFQKPMIAWGKCNYHGGKPPYPHAPFLYGKF